MERTENINLPMKVTITLDLDKLFNELEEHGWKPDRLNKWYSKHHFRHIDKDNTTGTILLPDQSPRYLFDLLSTITSHHFLAIIEPGPGKDALIKRLIHEYEK